MTSPSEAAYGDEGQLDLDIETASRRDCQPHYARLPKDWLSKPVFVPGAQPLNREIVVNGNRWTMGINNPLAKTVTPSQPITMQHLKVLFAVLTFYRYTNPVKISVGELARRVASSRGGRYFRDLLAKLDDLTHYWARVTYPDGSSREFRLLEAISIYRPAPRKRPLDHGVLSASQLECREIWLDRVSLHPDFVALLTDFERTMHLRFDAMKGLTSELAQSIYLFLPSRAYHHSQSAPWTINLATLWDQLCLKPVASSVRKKLLTQHRRSVLKQLDGSSILTGILRVQLTTAKHAGDYQLKTWVEREIAASGNSAISRGKLLEAWIESGRSEKAYKEKLKQRALLAEHETELLATIGVEVDGNARCFEIAKTLVGENRFRYLLSEAKAEFLEGRPPAFPTRALIGRLKKSIETAGRGIR